MPVGPRLFPSPFLLAYTVGASSSLVLPIWLAAAAGRFHLSAPQAGLLGSAELGCVAAASVLTALIRDPRHGRPLLLAGLIVSVLGNLVSDIAPAALALAAARCLTGLANGIVLACAARGAAQRPDAQRYFAAQMFAFVAAAILFFTAAPWLLATLGAGAAFLYCAGLGVMTLAMQWPHELTRQAPVAASTRPGPSASRLWWGLAFAGVALIFCGQSAVYTYVAAGARHAGLGLDSLSKVLAAGSVMTLAAPIAAERLAARCGRTRMLMLGVAGLSLSSLFVASQSDPRLFASGAVGLNLFTMFLAPVFLALMASLDPTGRGAGGAPAFFMIGSALGPAAGGMVIGAAGLPRLGLGAAAIDIFGLMSILLAVSRLTRWSRHAAPD